jgi:DNA-binding transcriptional LysR family regulator
LILLKYQNYSTSLNTNGADMELRHLKYFIVLAEELHFRRAAERLGIAQPPLSKQIRDLELELEVKLFERNQQRVLLTKAGKVFLKEMRLVMAQVDIAVTRVQQAHQGGAAKISIGFSAPAQQVLEKVLAALKNLTPELQISLQELNGLEQLTALRCNRIDLALGYLPDSTLLQRDGLEIKAIQSEKFYLAVSEQFPGIAEKKRDQQLNLETIEADMDQHQSLAAEEIERSSASRETANRRKEVEPMRSQSVALGESRAVGEDQENQDQPPTRKFDRLGSLVKDSPHQDQELGESTINPDLVLSIDTLNSTTLILAKEQWGDFAEIRLLEVLNQMNIKPRKIQEVSKMETALSLVAHNLGVTIVNSTFYSFQKSGVCYVGLEESLIRKDIGVIWRKDSGLGSLEEIVSLIKSEILEKA